MSSETHPNIEQARRTLAGIEADIQAGGRALQRMETEGRDHFDLLHAQALDGLTDATLDRWSGDRQATHPLL